MYIQKKRKGKDLKKLFIVLCVLTGIFICYLLSRQAPPQEVTVNVSTTVPDSTQEVILSAEPLVDLPIEETTSPEEPKEEYAFEYTEEELDLLARLICAEGNTESYETKLRIGSVVMNRVVDSTYFPDNIYDVIYQKNQFSVTTHKIKGVIMINRPACEDCREAAVEVLQKGSILPLEVQVFFEKSVKGNWVNTREVYNTYDGTTFSYIYPKK